MIVSIHQPNFMPYLGFFDKIANSDVLVILDDSQFQKNVFLNRNKIKTANGVQWLTIPVRRSIHQKINYVPISNEQDWQKTHIKTIELAYKKAKNFDRVFNEIKEIYYRQEWTKMIDLNMAIIYYIIQGMKMENKKIVFSSELQASGKGSELLLNIVKKVGGDKYLSGPLGKDYLDEDLFSKNGIEVIYQSFEHPIYTQCWGDFAPNMSAIDYLFNV